MVHGRDFWADLAGDSELTASFDAVTAIHLAWLAPWLAAQDLPAERDRAQLKRHRRHGRPATVRPGRRSGWAGSC
jgi:hypothetical protein